MEVEPAARRDAPWRVRLCDEGSTPFVRIYNPRAMNIGICNPEKHAPFVRICNPHAMNIGICNPVTLKQSHQQMFTSYTF